MNYTKNYRLPQWVKEDRIMMDDFNAAMASMESGMTASTSIANTAKQTADAAKQRVDTAYTPDNKPYAVGTYVGNSGKEWRAINVGFRPSFVILTGMEFTSAPTLQPMIRFGLVGPTTHSFARITDTGFEIRRLPEESYPEINYEVVNYSYIAFR